MADKGYYDIEREESIEGLRLSGLLREHDVAGLDFIKIDVQGGEDHVFRSLDDEDWSNVIGVNSEAYSAELYEDGATINSILEFLYPEGI